MNSVIPLPRFIHDNAQQRQQQKNEIYGKGGEADENEMDWGQRGVAKNKQGAYRRHFFSVIIITFSLILVSITLGVFLGPPLLVPGVDLAMQVSIAVVVHVFIFFIGFNTRTSEEFAVRLNPYMTLADWLLEGEISTTLAFIEILAQSIGAVAASALFYGVISSSPYNFLAPNGITNINVGMGFVLEIVATLLMSWVFFSNRLYKNRIRMALSMAYVVGSTSALVYPFIGLTTHSPFRWLANCVPSGSCGAYGFWVFITAPAIGIPLGTFLYWITSDLSAKNKKS